jgi:hypothetical protein
MAAYPADQSLTDRTVRDIVYTSAGGSGLRVRLSNAYGDRPVLVGAASVARQLRGAATDPATVRALRFGGSVRVSIPVGGSVLSDPLAEISGSARSRTAAVPRPAPRSPSPS